MKVSEAIDSAEHEQILHIRPLKGWTRLNLREFWSYRELLYEMVARDIRAKYKQSILGKVWVVIQPIILMLIYYAIFGVFLQLKTDTVPFPIFLLGGILIWQLLMACAIGISFSLLSNAHLMNKVYFPRLLLPVSQALVALMDFGFGLVVLVGFMLLSGLYPSVRVVVMPAFVLLAVLYGMALGLWFAPINVKYRDVGQIVPLLLQIAMFLSPVFYSSQFVPEQWRALYYLNPAAGIIQGFRWSLLNDIAPEPMALVGVGMVIVMFIGGLYFFRRCEATLVDSL